MREIFQFFLKDMVLVRLARVRKEKLLRKAIPKGCSEDFLSLLEPKSNRLDILFKNGKMLFVKNLFHSIQLRSSSNHKNVKL